MKFIKILSILCLLNTYQSNAMESMQEITKCSVLYDKILRPLGVDIREISKLCPFNSGSCTVKITSDANQKIKLELRKIQTLPQPFANRSLWGPIVEVDPDHEQIVPEGTPRSEWTNLATGSHEYIFHIRYENGIIEHICYEPDGTYYKAILELYGFEPILISRKVPAEVNDEQKTSTSSSLTSSLSSSYTSTASAQSSPSTKLQKAKNLFIAVLPTLTAVIACGAYAHNRKATKQ